MGARNKLGTNRRFIVAKYRWSENFAENSENAVTETRPEKNFVTCVTFLLQNHSQIQGIFDHEVSNFQTRLKILEISVN